MKEISQLPPSDSHRLVPVTSAEIQPGMVPGSWVLVVQGEAPCLNMHVTLEPAVHIGQPEYWRIEVVGAVPGGFCLTAIKEYTEALPLAGAMGTRGVEVVGKDFCQQLDVPPGGIDEPRRVYQVGEVTLAVQKIHPPRLLIGATGTVSTSGWTDARLVPMSDDVGDDGYAEFEFVADPPDGPALQVLRPIRASLSWERYGELQGRVKGVRVHAATNAVATRLGGEAPPCPPYQEIVQLRVGEKVAVDGGSLELEVSEIHDSRCPANVICIWEGFVAVSVITRQEGGEPETVNLSSLEPKPIELPDGHLLRLVDVVPYPGAGDPDAPQVAHIMVMRM